VTDVQNSTLQSIDEIETNGKAWGGLTAQQDALLPWLLVCREAWSAFRSNDREHT